MRRSKPKYKNAFWKLNVIIVVVVSAIIIVIIIQTLYGEEFMPITLFHYYNVFKFFLNAFWNKKILVIMVIFNVFVIVNIYLISSIIIKLKLLKDSGPPAVAVVFVHLAKHAIRYHMTKLDYLKFPVKCMISCKILSLLNKH